jgi:predicted porin
MKVKSIGVATLVAASMAWTPAHAADLGGDCCADLEERVAELEATTARKGNRRVSLTVSGQVNELVYWWDNGEESNVYQAGNSFSSSRFRFTGNATISSDWSAGYLIEVETYGAKASDQGVDDDDGKNSNFLNLRHSAWYLKSRTLGKVSVGYTSFAADDILSSIGLGGTASATQGNIDSAPGMGLYFGGTDVKVKDVFDVRDVDRGNLVRYDSPSIVGFVLSAAWGEDDRWDVALRYAAEFNGIKIAAGLGYHEDTQPQQGQIYNYNEIRGAISVLHVPSGLFADFGYLRRDFNPTAYQINEYDEPFRDFNYWYVRGGIYRRWIPLGKTSLFGEYGEASGGQLEGEVYEEDVSYVSSSKGRFYGVGLQQQIDAAAMEVYLGWRRFDTTLDGYDFQIDESFAIPADSVDTVYTGARIKF